MKEERSFLPLFMKVRGKKAVIFGAGQIAGRRAQVLLRYGVVLQVIAPQCGSEMQELINQYGSGITYEQGSYRPGCLMDEDMDYVFAATDDQTVNEAIGRECRHREILVNVASDQSLCDFYFPGLVELEEMVIGISSEGVSHEGVKHLREKLEAMKVELMS